jgi:uncharacterized delta-60 repeat protein
VALALVVAALLCVAPSFADLSDPTFGSGGVVRPALPSEASQAEAGIVDLVATRGGTVGVLKGLAGRGYFGLVRLRRTALPDSAFGQDGYTPPLPSQWAGFRSEPQAEAAAVQPDGKLVVAGYMQQGLNGPVSFGTLLARYRADGTLDPGFGAGGVVATPRRAAAGGIVFHGVAVAPRGRIVAVGSRNEHFRGFERTAAVVSAFRLDGSPDPGFGKGGRVLFSQRARHRAYTSLRDVEVLRDGKILVAGYRNFRLFLARLTPDGRLDRNFGGGDGTAVLGIHNRACCPPAAIAVQRDGRIVLAANGGPFHTPRVYLARYRADGRLDRSFGHAGVEAPFLPWRLSYVNDVAVGRDGSIFTVGRGAATRRNRHGFAYAVFRNRPNGSADQSFGRRGLLTFRFGDQSSAGAVLTQPDGSVLTGGSFATRDQESGLYTTTLLLARFLGGSTGGN